MNCQYLATNQKSMLYPLQLVEIGHNLEIHIPDPGRIKLTYTLLLEKDQSVQFPFWAKIWPSAVAMSAFLTAEPQWTKDKRVLEIGAGIGLPSLIMAHHARETIISDHNSDAVELIRKNIAFAGLKNVRALCLDWNHFPDDLESDTVLLSDINYAPDQFAPLLKLIRQYLQQGAAVIISTPRRITASSFAEALQPFIRRSVLHTVHEPDQAIEIQILLLQR